MLTYLLVAVSPLLVSYFGLLIPEGILSESKYMAFSLVSGMRYSNPCDEQ